MNRKRISFSTLRPEYLFIPNLAVDIITGVIEQIKVTSNGTFTVGDYGTADGGTSMNLMCVLIEKVKELHGEDYPIQIIYEDCRYNDYNALFQHITDGFKKVTYMDRFQNIYPMATNVNFYQQCVPPNLMDFIFSITAMHRLSRSPCDIPDAIAIFLSDNEDAKKVWASQANDDWETILLRREKELKSGGYFLCGIRATEDRETGFFKLMTDAWNKLVLRHVITQEEYEKTNFNIYPRSKEEIRKPFDDPNSKVFNTGLKLLNIYRRPINTPAYKEFVEDGGDLVGYIEMYVNNIKTWPLPTFREGLASSRSEEETEIIIKTFIKAAEEVIEEDPTRITYCPEFDFVLIQKAS